MEKKLYQIILGCLVVHGVGAQVSGRKLFFEPLLFEINLSVTIFHIKF